MSRLFGALIDREARRQSAEALFVVAAPQLLAYTSGTLPRIYCNDAVFSQVLEYYRIRSIGLFGSQVEAGHRIEKQALTSADLCIFSSHWAADEAIRRYGFPVDKVVVLGFGANCPDEILTHAHARQRHRVGPTFLYLAREWQPKGGPTALRAFQIIKERIPTATLTICGITPSLGDDITAERSITVLPHLRKGNPEDLSVLINALADADFLISPSQFEAYGIALVEAASVGTIVLAADVGGVREVVVPGKTGILLPSFASPSDYAAAAIELWHSPERLHRMRIEARARYTTSLSWQNWSSLTSAAIRRLLAKTS